MSDRNRESDRILSVYKVSVGFHRIAVGIRYGFDRFLSVPIIGFNDLGYYNVKHHYRLHPKHYEELF